MICHKCGADMPDTGAFCTSCGERVIVSETPTAVDIVKKHALSKNYFLASLFFTLTYVLLLLYGIYCTVDVIVSFIRYIPVLEANPEYTEILLQSFSTSFGVIGAMTYSIPIAVATIIPLWLIRKNAKNPDAPMKTGGFTTFKVLLIINMAFVVMSMLSGIVAMIVLPIGGISLIATKETVSGIILIISGIAGAVLMLGSTVFCIVYYVFAIRSVNSVIKTCKTGVATGKISRFVGVMSYISAGTAVLAFVTLSIMAIPFICIDGDIFYFIYVLLANIFNFIVNLCTGHLIFAYRRDIEQLKANSSV